MQTKTLHIVRHGKALQGAYSIEDFDRPLTEGGIVNSIAVARRFAAQHVAPDLITTSHAARAMHTAHIFARETNYSQDCLHVDENLYFQGYKVIYSALTELPESIDSIMIVGHNPDLTNLANKLGARINQISTSGVVTICFDTDYWSKIDTASKNFSFLDKKDDGDKQ